MPGAGKGSSGGKSSKGGSGHASNAALQSDEDVMARRAANFNGWKHAKLKKVRNEFMDYANSPTPPRISRTK